MGDRDTGWQGGKKSEILLYEESVAFFSSRDLQNKTVYLSKTQHILLKTKPMAWGMSLHILYGSSS